MLKTEDTITNKAGSPLHEVDRREKHKQKITMQCGELNSKYKKKRLEKERQQIPRLAFWISRLLTNEQGLFSKLCMY